MGYLGRILAKDVREKQRKSELTVDFSRFLENTVAEFKYTFVVDQALIVCVAPLHSLISLMRTANTIVFSILHVGKQA